MKIREAIELGVRRLKEAGIKTPITDTHLILSKVLNVPRWKLISEKEEKIPPEKLREFFSLIEKRAERYPLGYILGEKEFFNVKIKVEEGVLIPRPETEILVEECLKRIPESKKATGLEIGVGSGAISIALLRNRPLLTMYGVDISEKAVQIALLNAKINKVSDRLILIKSNLFENVPQKRFDFIVSNPPYVSEEEYESLEEEVKKEPKEALVAGKEGTKIYEMIVREGKRFLKKEGFFAFEIGYNQGEKVKSILESEGFKVKIIKDLQGFDRVIIGERND
ncbi:peptide chain release factor N(5)-glutamine methyltransferase [Persephonella atlantica]|uniref:Release factor glutamine methyltransferase n=1 Tax=Persephonella atlantica TaxID=2699429 RepID=A0ABS1GJA5_9AQUI|nr:peptide chain release factor N(5)-glutamine methyltransferase [Persephonella atlantica]MBK3333014.1 peptide chain release factor N(5)-glutamine methyltransferase [Persephonella atlantica]